MATVVNERDVLLQGTVPRLLDFDLPANVVVPALKSLDLTAPATAFRVATSGTATPSAITLTVNLEGVPDDTVVTWTMPSGAAVLTNPSNLSRTLAFADMASDFVTVTASVTSGGLTYQDTLSFSKVRDGSNGTAGSRGSLSVARSITGSVWSDTEALAAITAAGGTALLATDTCTLFNGSTSYSEMRRYSGTAWVAVGSTMPGSALMTGSVTTEKLLVTGLGIALNSDPNTVDITAWTGSGLSIVSDTTAPNGATRLQCAGAGATVMSRRFALDTAQNYRVRTWAKQVSGTSTAFLIVAFYDAAGALISGTASPSGWTNAGTFHYYGLAGTEPSSTWTEYSASFGPDETFKIPAGAKYACVGMVSNFTGTGVQALCGLICHMKTTGVMVVDGSLDASKINTRGLSLKDDAGNVILSAGTALDYSRVGGLGKEALEAAVGTALTERLSKSSADVLHGPIGLSAAAAILVGTVDDGIFIGEGGILGRKGGATTFIVDQAGNSTYSGALQGATGIFSGALAAGAFDPKAFDAIAVEHKAPGTVSATVPAPRAGWSSMSMRLTMVGAGGGAGGGYFSAQPNSDPTSGGGGGGEGTRTIVVVAEVAEGDALTITVGAGGTGGAPSSHWGGSYGGSIPAGNGTSGGATAVVHDGITYSAAGGGYGTGGSANHAAGGVNVPGGSLGAGYGISGLSSNAQTHAAGGVGGSTFYGPGGAESTSASPNSFGAGGGGGRGSGGHAGGGGSGGYVFVEFFDPNSVVLNDRYSALVQWLDTTGHGAVPTNAR